MAPQALMSDGLNRLLDCLNIRFTAYTSTPHAARLPPGPLARGDRPTARAAGVLLGHNSVLWGKWIRALERRLMDLAHSVGNLGSRALRGQ